MKSRREQLVAERPMPLGDRGSNALLLLFNVQRMLAETSAIFFELQLFATWFAADCVVEIARFFAHQEDGFSFLLALGHGSKAPHSGGHDRLRLPQTHSMPACKIMRLNRPTTQFTPTAGRRELRQHEQLPQLSAESFVPGIVTHP